MLSQEPRSPASGFGILIGWQTFKLTACLKTLILHGKCSTDMGQFFKCVTLVLKMKSTPSMIKQALS